MNKNITKAYKWIVKRAKPKIKQSWTIVRHSQTMIRKEA